MSHSNAPHSHPICPTCQSDLTGRETLERLASAVPKPLNSDDLVGAYDEIDHLIIFLGALAEAGPHAAAAHAVDLHDIPIWVTGLSWLADELTKETKRRLNLLLDAGKIWQTRAESATADKAATPVLYAALQAALAGCPCTIKERQSGHRSDCFAPRVEEALALADRKEG
jgi:hypothetical protein